MIGQQKIIEFYITKTTIKLKKKKPPVITF